MPKKKGGKKGAKIIDGVATNEMTREQLMGHVKRMQMELDREREERNFFMLEREKLYALWGITLEQLSTAKTHARLADVRMDENEREREWEMHVYKQKLRHLMTEQSRKVSEVRLHNLRKMKQVQENMSTMETSIRDSLDSKNKEIFRGQLSMHQVMRRLQMENTKKSSNLRQDFCQEIRRMESTYLRLMFERNNAQELENKVEIQRTTEEKSEMVQQLMDIHSKQIAEMKDYFNEITVNNFAVISAMQQDLSTMRQREELLNKELTTLREQNSNLQKSMTDEKLEFENKIANDRKSADEIKKQLLRSDKRLKEVQKYAEKLELAQEALIQKSELRKKENIAFRCAFSNAIIDVQKRAQLKNLILQMKLNAMASSNNRNVRKVHETSEERNDDQVDDNRATYSSTSSDGGGGELKRQ